MEKEKFIILIKYEFDFSRDEINNLWFWIWTEMISWRCFLFFLTLVDCWGKFRVKKHLNVFLILWSSDSSRGFPPQRKKIVMLFIGGGGGGVKSWGRGSSPGAHWSRAQWSGLSRAQRLFTPRVKFTHSPFILQIFTCWGKNHVKYDKTLICDFTRIPEFSDKPN